MLELLFETDIITTRHENHNDTISGYSQLLNSFLYEVFAIFLQSFEGIDTLHKSFLFFTEPFGQTFCKVMVGKDAGNMVETYVIVKGQQLGFDKSIRIVARISKHGIAIEQQGSPSETRTAFDYVR